MIYLLSNEEKLLIVGRNCWRRTCPDGVTGCGCGIDIGPSPGGYIDPCKDHQAPSPLPTCLCLDYAKKTYPISNANNADACWDICCKGKSGYAASKFGAFTRACNPHDEL